ncbi:MAG: VWA domain-containing protein [Pseudomonadota bacterium]
MAHLDTSSQTCSPQSAAWNDACLAIELAAGMVSSPTSRMPTFCVKAQAGPVLDAWLERLQDVLPRDSTKQLQGTARFSDLLGGLDLSATLAAGKRVYEEGLLSRCHEGVLIIPLSAAMMPEMAAGFGAVLESGRVSVDGLSPASDQDLNLGLVIIDQGEDGEEFLSIGLRDRLMFHLDLSQVSLRDIGKRDEKNNRGIPKPALCDAALLEELCAVSLSLGLASIRPPHQALQVASFHAGLQDRSTVNREDVSTAIRLSLVNRALVYPIEEQDEALEEEANTSNPDEEKQESNRSTSDTMPNEMDVNSILATLPPELLMALKSNTNKRRGKRLAGRSGGKRISFTRGKPVGSIRGSFDHGKRLDLIATLRASAPWQTMRRQHSLNPNRIQVRKRDFHVKRYLKPSESTTIFVVDASGSTAINRLAEAKGAVELLLGESYARRDHVALISLRGQESETILPPTRSLTRARRTLSGLRGGGGTPLAHGLQKAMAVAQDELRKGRSPSLVLLTDGSANVSLEGLGGRAQAMEDAISMARGLASLEVATLVIDVSRSANGHAKTVADALRAKYVPMPFASSKNISDAVRVSQH